MILQFNCPQCKKQLKVKGEMAGKRAACPGCKKVIVIPAPKKTPAAQSPGNAAPKPAARPVADMDKLAAEMLARSSAAENAATPARKITMECPFCFEPLELDHELGGKQSQCPECRRIIKVDKPKDDAPSDWREGNRVGPQFTKENIEAKPDDVWTTADRAGVSAGSLAKAGALPAQKRSAVGVGIWIRRGLIAVVVVGLCVGGYFAASYYQTTSRQKQALAQAEAALKDLKANKKSMPRLWQAAYHRAAAEFHARNSKPDLAQRDVIAARTLIALPGTDRLNVEDEVSLVKLALTQLELGGSDEEATDEKKVAWSTLLEDLQRTLSAFKTTEGKLLGMRRVCLELINKKQQALAKILTIKMTPNAAEDAELSPLAASQIAVLLAMNEKENAQRLAPAPKDKKAMLPAALRLGYAQGLALGGDYAKARGVAGQPGIAVERLMAHLAIGEIAFLTGNSAEAKSSMNDATKVVGELQKRGIPDLVAYELVWLAARVDNAGAKEWSKLIRDKEGSALAQFEILSQQAKQQNTTVDPGQITNKKSLAYALAVKAGARAKGYADSVATVDMYDQTLHPLIYIGAGLSVKD